MSLGFETDTVVAVLGALYSLDDAGEIMPTGDSS
jgi:hypothetical protein